MARLTKNSYKRKIIVFGLLVFMSIALISTGFAAWVMSQGDKEESGGNVSVGVVNDGRITLNQVKYTPVVWGYNEDYSALVELTGENYDIATKDGLNFKFEPLFGDKNGAITWEGIKEGNVNCEILEIKVVGLITNPQLLKGGVLNVELEISEGVKQCIDNDYIEAPSGFTYKMNGDTEFKTENGNYVLLMDVQPNDNNTFEFSVKFSWGSAFNFANPAGTDNDNINTTSAQLDELKNKIEIFRALLYGYYDNGTENCLKTINANLDVKYEELTKAFNNSNLTPEVKEATIAEIQTKISGLEAQKATLINGKYSDSYKLTIIAATDN